MNEVSVERTITYEGVSWRVRVNPTPIERDSPSGLELVFMESGGSLYLTAPVGRSLLASLSRHGLDVEEAELREELRRALARQRNEGAGGRDDGEQ